MNNHQMPVPQINYVSIYDSC